MSQSEPPSESADQRRYPARPLLGVGGVIFRDDEVLLIERGKEPLKGWWTVPGGLVECGERVEAAVIREVWEETGLHVRPVQVAAVFQRIMPDLEGRTEFHYVIIDVLCEVEGGTLKAASDVSAAAWIPIHRMHELKMAPGTPPVIREALQVRALREQGIQLGSHLTRD